VPWNQCETLCRKVGTRIVDAAFSKGIPKSKVFASFRVTQIYETGAAVYIYFGLAYHGIK
jgi:alkyldihydroxyacetonephosphate synthase